MSILDTIFENEDFQNVMTENEAVLAETEQKISDFPKVLKSFILANPNEFLAENGNQIYKNVKTFTEVATAQYIQELSTVMSENFQMPNDVDPIEENSAINAYL